MAKCDEEGEELAHVKADIGLGGRAGVNAADGKVAVQVELADQTICWNNGREIG
jgi:hypothetical protein